MATTDLNRILTQLNNAKVKREDPATYTAIASLIRSLQATQATVLVISSGSGGPGGSGFATKTATFLTATNQVALLPNSRQLLPGTNVAFDDSVSGERTINVTSSSGDDYVVMGDGATPIPSPVDDGFGNFIYTLYTP